MRKRKQRETIELLVLGGFIGIAIWNMFLTLAGTIIPFYPFGASYAIAFVLFLAYPIVKSKWKNR